jgi:hypothetical protein
VEHVPALPFEDVAHRQLLVLLVDAPQHPPLPQPLPERLGADSEGPVADIVAEALCGCVGGVRVEPERIALQPAHPLPLGLIGAVGIERPSLCPLAGVGPVAVRPRHVRSPRGDRRAQQLDEAMRRIGARLVVALGTGRLPERPPGLAPQFRALPIAQGTG